MVRGSMFTFLNISLLSCACPPVFMAGLKFRVFVILLGKFHLTSVCCHPDETGSSLYPPVSRRRDDRLSRAEDLEYGL